jgi:hypothetical protein
MRLNFICSLPLLSVGLLSGCGPADTVEEQTGTPSGDLAAHLQPIETWREDQVAEITPSEGSWGGWMQQVYCNPGFWAVGYRMRVEGSRGRKDDTALNSVQLLCKSRGGATEWISSYDGLWGNWQGAAECMGSYLSGARLRVEAPQGNGDDTGANNAEFTCSGGGYATAPGGQGWGQWSFWQSCPVNSAVCGLSIRFEGSQGGGDDTAMNGLRLYCCSL